MKVALILIFSFCFGQMILGQEWRDSLTVARKAYQNKEYEKAFRYYKSAQSKAPEGIDLSDEMGQSAYKSHQYDAAKEIYQQNVPEELDAKKKSDRYHNLGNTKMSQKDYQGAIEAYKEALKNDPNDQETRYNLSEAIRQQNKSNKNNQNQNGGNNNQNQNQNQNQGNNNNKSNSSQGNSSKLQDKSVDKKLDELMKQESQTKRKLSGKSTNGTSSKSGKDW